MLCVLLQYRKNCQGMLFWGMNEWKQQNSTVKSIIGDEQF